MLLSHVDKVSIVTPQNHYVEMTAMHDYEVVSRSRPLHNGAICFSVIVENGFSEDGTAGNAHPLGINLHDTAAGVPPSGHGDSTGSIKILAELIGQANIPFEEIKIIKPVFIIPAHCTGRNATLTIKRQKPDRFF